MLFNITLSHAQSSIFTASDSAYIKRAILEPLRLIKETHDGSTMRENPFGIGSFSIVDKKKAPELWYQKLQAQIELSLWFANELMNHFDFQRVAPHRQNAGIMLPPCFYDESPIPDSIAGVKNKECYALCIKSIQEYNAKIEKLEFERPIRVAFSENIHYIVSYFKNHEDNLTESDIDKYVYPVISRYIDNESKQNYFKKSLNSYLGKNQN